MGSLTGRFSVAQRARCIWGSLYFDLPMKQSGCHGWGQDARLDGLAGLICYGKSYVLFSPADVRAYFFAQVVSVTSIWPALCSRAAVLIHYYLYGPEDVPWAAALC